MAENLKGCPTAAIGVDDGIITVTLDRPDKLNAISHEMTASLWEAVLALGDRDDLRCMVITAKGRYFTAGQDISSPPGNRPGDPATMDQHPGWNFRRHYRSHHLLYDEMEAVEKPVIMAVQGRCLGAGVEMAGSADFRFCTPEASFALPEVKLGGIAGSGGTSRLTRLIGPSWAKWMAMAAMEVDANEAKSIGLVHRVYPAESLLDEVYAFCRHLMSVPAEAVGLAKMAVDVHADVTDRNIQRQFDRVAVYSTLAAFEKSMERFGFDKNQGPKS
ncbi:MAG: enoyl-CoA hydratase/isomerase family protein [bacterium]|nr:enoyl-CoA hydratase/isomerase family protein [bacterium]